MQRSSCLSANPSSKISGYLNFKALLKWKVEKKNFEGNYNPVSWLPFSVLSAKSNNNYLDTGRADQNFMDKFCT